MQIKISWDADAIFISRWIEETLDPDASLPQCPLRERRDAPTRSANVPLRERRDAHGFPLRSRRLLMGARTARASVNP